MNKATHQLFYDFICNSITFVLGSSDRILVHYECKKCLVFYSLVTAIPLTATQLIFDDDFNMPVVLSAGNFRNLTAPKFTYIPHTEVVGVDSFSIDISDNIYTLAAKPVITIIVEHKNTAPMIIATNYTVECCRPQRTLLITDIVINDDANNINGKY